MRTKMTFDDLWKKPHYADILALIREYGGEEGLQQRHLRYALMEKPELHPYTEIEMKKYFGDNFTELFNTLPIINKPFLRKGCVRSRQELTNFLSNLLEMGIIEKHGKKTKVKYRLTHRYLRESDRLDVIDKVNWWDAYHVIRRGEERFTINSKIGYDSLTLFGPPEEEVIAECLRNIVENARKILEIKYKRTQLTIPATEWFKKAKRSLQENKDYLRKETELTSFSLFYTGEIMPIE